MELFAWICLTSGFIIAVAAIYFLTRRTRKLRSKSEDIATAALLGVVMPQLMENSNLEMNEGKEEN